MNPLRFQRVSEQPQFQTGSIAPNNLEEIWQLSRLGSWTVSETSLEIYRERKFKLDPRPGATCWRYGKRAADGKGPFVLSIFTHLKISYKNAILESTVIVLFNATIFTADMHLQ